MRGNKFYTKLCLVIIAILCLGIIGGVCLTHNKISKVKAEDTTKYMHETCSQRYDDGVVFSVEQVYFKSDRTTPLYLSTGETNAITNVLGYPDNKDNPNNYFLNYGGLGSANDSLSKKIINNGDYAYLQEKVTRTVYDEGNNPISLNQGIMITLGGYVFDDNGTEDLSDDVLHSNNETSDTSKLGVTYKHPTDNKNYYSSHLQSINIEMKRNGKIFTSTPTTGEASLRTYNNGLYFDFVYFLDASETNEGYYEIRFTYTKEDGESQTHSFNFYILLSSKYDNVVTVNGQEYTMAPNFSNYKTAVSYNEFLADVYDDKYPVLTYDYKHYDMKYTYIHNDLVVNANVVYEEIPNQGIDRLVVKITTNGVTDTQYYDCKDLSNDIVSFLFANVGKYEFEFNYVYYYNNERLVVENLTIEDKILNIYGYELKYAKTGFASSDLRHLSIVKNDTIVIPINGYDNSSVKANKSKDLGYMYEFVLPEEVEGGKKKSGDITKIETADVTNKTIEGVQFTYDTVKIKFIDIKSYDFVDTDQGGLWFNLNDFYDLTDSYYVYSPTKFVNGSSYDMEDLNKVTTFTKMGYYFVKAGFRKQSSSSTINQYFAFRISSGVADVKLFTTKEDAITNSVSDERLYSNQYTNKNVYATWDDPTTFASAQTATLYYTRQGYNNIYESKSNLIKFANGGANVSLVSSKYEKGTTLITNNGSYLLEVKVDGSDTKAYYYFTIDKEDISGLEVLAISSASMGSKLVYNVARDEKNNAITYTTKVVIDKNFTFWWDDKKSGAQISGSYTYTPIISSNINKDKIESTENSNNYLWLINDFTLGNTSNNISIEKPATKTSTVDPNNVLVNQGIYWFYLIDEAGNEMNYMVVVDNTAALIQAKSIPSGNNVISGEMIAEGVNFEWGTHKAIQLSSDFIEDTNSQSASYKSVLDNISSYIFEANSEKKYYKVDKKSNFSDMNNYFELFNSNGVNELYLLVENQKAIIETIKEDITINKGQNSLSHKEISLNNWHNVSIALNDTETIYIVNVFGNNQVETKDTNSTFTVILNPDKSEGKIKSKADETEKSFRNVVSYNTAYKENDAADVADFENNYDLGQATDDGLVVFEWNNNDGTDYEVGKVYYEYYPLMEQSSLNEYNKNSERYKFYPYDFAGKTTFDIYDFENSINNYEIDSDGTKTIYRSTVLNAGYVLYYDQSGNLVSKNATLPGMYVITRVYKKDVVDANDSRLRKYVFFVDRNNIIDYSTTNVSQKIVGENIELLSQEEIKFTNFTQAVDNYEFGNSTYNIYLQTNRLPMQIRIPTGKYASLVNNEIIKTSNSNSGLLNLSIRFIDTHKLLGYIDTDTGELLSVSFKLFDSIDFSYKDEGYITYSLTREKLVYDIENKANIENYLTACSVTNSDWLSLPGVYVIELSDNVGKELDKKYKITDYNILTIGVEITKSKPIVEMYANQAPANQNNADYANFDKEKALVFNTNKAYVRYELNDPDDSSFEAQVDNSYIVIERIDEGVQSIYYNSLSNTGIINRNLQFTGSDGVEYNYIQRVEDAGKYVVWLDTGLTIVDGKITDYKEYVYNVYVRYILKDGSYVNCYVYNVKNKNGVISNEKYYESKITVNIDRTPFLENLENSIKGQEIFLEEYVNTYSDDEFVLNGKLDSKIYNTVAYRGQDGEDYYAVVNTLYYYYIDKGEYAKAEDSMYAVRVDKDDEVKIDGTMYYRPMYYNNGSVYTEAKNRRMALLPICEQFYNNVTGFATFSKTSWEDFHIVDDGSNNWEKCFKLSSNGYGYYEVIELDVAGNIAQYMIYVAEEIDGKQTDETATLEFTDVTNTYGVTFDFSTNSPSISVNVPGITDQFSLIPFNGVSDMFGLSVTRDGITNSGVNICKDWFYKVSVVDNQEEYIYYLNYNNINLAEKLYDIFSKYSDQNYKITLTNRYNQSLTVSIEVLSKKYELNLNNFKTKYNTAGTSYWYIQPSDLNSPIAERVTYYVRTIELTDLTDSSIPVVRFTLDKDGIVKGIYIGDSTNSVDSYKADVNETGTSTTTNKGDDIIKLDAEREYQVRLIDCAMKEYGPIVLYAYDNGAETDVSITAYGEYTISSNVYYSANPIEVKYNKNIFTNISIEVYKDGLYLGRFTDGFNIDDNILVEATTEGKLNTLKFNPYKLVEGIKDTGAKLEFELSLIYDNKARDPIKIILDNRVPLINLINTSGDDKTNIINVKYVNSKTMEEKVTLDTNTLFSYVPTLTLSETVVLDLSNYDSSIYIKDTFNYYHSYLYLIEYRAKTDWTVTNLGVASNSILNISPKEGALGRYVLIIAFHNDAVNILTGDNVDLVSDNLIAYKAFVFNISSTANAMYEVQDSNGEVQDYDSVVTGESLYDTLTLAEQISFRDKFGFVADNPDEVEVPTGDRITNSEEWAIYDKYLSDVSKYKNFEKFKNQSVPLYISIDKNNLVPNGDNGIQTIAFSTSISRDYTLTIYKVYSKVHSTYVAILKVEPADELVNTNVTNPTAIRFKKEADGNPTTDLIKVNEIMFNTYGELFFTNFNRGGISDSETDLSKLNLARENKLYMEVWYKYNDDKDGIKKVGDFFGDGTDDKNTNSIKFKTSGTYIIYLKDLAGNTRVWSNGITVKDYLTITIMPEVIVTVNDDVPVEYNYYNLTEHEDGTIEGVTVDVLFAGSGYYDNGSVKMYAYLNGSDVEYITKHGGRNNITSYMFTEYGTYRVVVEAKVGGEKITKTLVFSIINPYEARLALDFTQISKYNITKVINSTTKADVTSQFNFLLNEGFIYSKLITHARLSEENVFGSTMGKQTFKVFYTVDTDSLVRPRECSFEFTVNNQTPSLKTSVKPGESTTKEIVIKFNAQTIYRQVGDCYIVVNGVRLMPISYNKAYDGTTTLTLSDVGDYYVKIETDSGRVITSFKVTIKEPLNTMSIILIVAVILVVVGLIVTFIVLRTRMKVK